MGIDDIEGINLLESLGAKRVVLSREVSIDKIKEFKTKTKMPLETFVHGALCVSYSGNCLMSGLIGMRSGNRGRCVGSCRKLYNLVNLTDDVIFPKRYLLSMKDLNTTEIFMGWYLDNEYTNIDLEDILRKPTAIFMSF